MRSKIVETNIQSCFTVQFWPQFITHLVWMVVTLGNFLSKEQVCAAESRGRSLSSVWGSELWSLLCQRLSSYFL